jgi:transposase
LILTEQDESFFSNADERFNQFEELKVQTARDQERIKLLSDEVTYLNEVIRDLKRDKFGKKSERWESPEQGCLFNEAEVESKKPDPDVEDDLIEGSETQVPAHTRKRGYRRPLPETLLREVVKLELPIEEQIAKDGTPLKIIGWEISEKLKYEPAKVSVTQYHRAKYGVDSGDYEKTAPAVPSIIPKGIATPELLAAICIGKYADALPLYRMEDIFKRHDIDLTRGTMARWVIKVAEACQPIWNVLSDRLLSSFYVAVDETHVQVLKENGRAAETKSWMWVRSTPFGKQKIILFDYSPTRSGVVAKSLFLDFKGHLQSDGLNCYEALESEDITRLGCNMHGRRRFEKAKVTGAMAGRSLGEIGMKFYKRIYDLEEEIRDKTPDERYALRLEFATPIWKEMEEWLGQTKSKVPKKSKIGDAFSYMESQLEYLKGYLKDGRLECDNGFTERAIRKFAIGRNNWMFSDSEAGANASSLLYSLVVTAKVNGVNPYRALVKLFTELPKAQTIEDYEALANLILVPELTA